MSRSKIFCIVVLWTMLFSVTSTGQTPCTNPPNGPGCKCSTAEILCTPDDIDGFSFTMSSSNNLGGIPSNDLCPGTNAEASQNNGNVPNNVNWFGFIAWCTDLTINVEISDCTSGGGGSKGVQMALFATCGWPWDPIQCITESNEACGSGSNYPTSQTFIANGLTIGNTYYFMLDGCGGSACTVTLDVVGVCGTGTIDPWTQPINGPLNTCVGQTNTYMAEDLDGATDFHWYLNGSLLTQGTELNTINYAFNAVGTYQLCVDVSNDPCIPQSNPPAQTCITINVYDANAGNITATPNPACPEQDINWSVTGYIDDPNYSQFFFLTDASGTIIEIFPDDNGVLNFDECGTYTLYSYNFAPPGAFPDPVVGNNVSSINCNTGCCDLKPLNIVVQDNQAPVFTNPPDDLDLSCFAVIPPMEPLAYTDNCLDPGTVTGTETGTIDLCDGGTITRTWEITDLCDNTTTYVQTITVPPVPEVEFINPPADETVPCNEVFTIALENLNYTNNGSSSCLIQGSVAPTTVGTVNKCGGTLTKTWTFTDTCGRTITHEQMVTVEPMEEAEFINPPADVTLSCDQALTFNPQSINYSNNGTGICLIQGSVVPQFTNNLDICGGSFEVTYSYTDTCGRTVEHIQNVTILPPPEADFINAPPSLTIDCGEIEANSGSLSYSNNVTGVCGISGTSQAELIGTPNICGGSYTFKWSAIDQCDRPVEHVQTITVTPAPPPVWVNPPANITVNCDQIPTSGGTLQAINNATNSCEVDTLINPVQSGSADICGGTITYTWTFTDACQNTISHTQTVTVNPMPAPTFVNPPASTTVTCETIPASAPDLTVINNGPPGCNINTTVSPVLEGMPNPCGGSFNFKWTYDGQCQDIEHTQTITVTPPPQGVFQNPPANITVSCDQIPAPNSFPNLTITNNLTGNCAVNASVTPTVSGYPQNYCGGTINVVWTHTDQCQRTTSHTQTITVLPANQANFTNVPPDITVNCAEIDNTPITLTATNNANASCLITGTAVNNRTGNITYCGGVLTDTWTFVDLCGRTTTATRNITVNPAPQASFDAPPADITIDCDDVASLGPNLSYSNGLSGICGITGQAPFVLVGSYTACGGQIFGTWTFNDQCNRTISHIQNITVNPAPDPIFLNPPMDLDLGCGGENMPPDFLELSNGGIGICAIELTAPLISITEDDGVYTNVWQFTHPCTNQLISYTQITNTLPAPNLITETPEISICAGQTFDLSTIVVTDLNNTDPDYTYHSIIPGDPSNEVLPEVMPNDGDVYFIQGENSFGCTDAVGIYFIFGDIPMAGGNGSKSVCNDGTTLNLNTMLNGNFDTGGSWIQTNGSNLNLTNPTAVNFLNIPAGNYTVSYIVESNNPNCPSDTANFVITVTNKIALNLTSLECLNNNTYEIKLTSNASTVTSTLGQVEELTNDTFRIYNIPQGQSVSITGNSSNNICITTLDINAPNCACPFIEIPQGQNYYAQCQNISTPITLSVTVPAGMQANWYTAPVGGSPFLSNSLTYNHTNYTQGIYQYYVETFDPVSLCVSLTRLEITVEILALPTVTNYDFPLCDASNDGAESFDLTSIHGNVTSLSNTVSYHLTAAQAQSNTNPLPGVYVNVSNPQKIFASVTSSTGCQNIAEVNLILNPSPDPQINKTDESCAGEDDGSITIGNHNAAQDWQYSFDNINFSTQSQYSDLSVNNYILFARNSFGCKSSTPFSIGEGMIVNISALLFECDNRGTLTDPTDDIYTVTINAQNTLGINGTYVVTADGVQVGTFPYGSNQTFTLPANGSTVEITAADALRSCSAKRSIGPLTSCSTDCIETLTILSSVCSDNNTPTDPADDFYTISFEATVQNGSSTNDYLLFVDGGLKGKFAYDAVHTTTTPATGNTINIRAQDSEDLQCSDTQAAGPLTPCSNDCLIDATLVSVNCFNPGDTPEETDDYYEIVVNAQLINGGNSTTYRINLSNGNTLTGSYGIPLTITLPADNTSPVLTFTDAVRSECSDEITVNALTPCSAPCVIDAVVSNITCSNAGTNDEEGDDEYTFELRVSGNSSMFTIDEFNFKGVTDTNITMGPYKIANGIPTFTVYFDDNPNCKEFVTMIIPPACSSCDQTVDAGSGGEISCTTPEILLTGTSSEPGNFNWILNGEIITSGSTLLVGQPGTYYFDAAYADGCSATDSVKVTIDANLPVVTVSRGHTLTCELKEVTITGSATGSNLSYEWTDETGNILGTGLTLNVTTAGNYYFRAYNSVTGCSSARILSEVTLDLDNPSSVIYARPTSLIDCVIKSVVLYTDLEDNVEYTWRALNSDLFTNEKEIEIFNPDTYFLTAIDTISGCNSTSDIVIPEFIEYPIIFLNVDDTLDCANSSVVIDASGTQLGDDLIYQWKDQSKNVISTEVTYTFPVTEPGTYYLEVSNVDNGCTNEDTVSVVSFVNEIDLELPVNIDVEEGKTYQFNVVVNIPASEIKTISWTPAAELSCSDCLTPSLLVTKDQEFVVTVEDIYGCKGMAVVRVNSVKVEVVTIPNVISVSSGTNNGFTLYGNDQVLLVHSLKIFDRWGNLMFTRNDFLPNDPSLGWNGKINGKHVEQGVYVYVFEVDLLQSGRKIYKGDLTVIR